MVYRLLIVVATIIWGSSFVIVKDVTGFLTTGWILVVRFSVAAVLLALVFAKKRHLYLQRDYLFYGGLFGVALCALVVALITEPAPVVLTCLSLEQLVQLTYLAVACTTLALLFQNIGQKHLPPSSASLLLSLESPFGVAFSVAFGAETLNAQVLCGFVLIFAAIMVSEVLPEHLSKVRAKGSGEQDTPTGSDVAAATLPEGSAK